MQQMKADKRIFFVQLIGIQGVMLLENYRWGAWDTYRTSISEVECCLSCATAENPPPAGSLSVAGKLG